MKYYLGVDIGGTKCAVVISEKKSTVIKDKIRFATESSRGWQAVVADILTACDEIISRNLSDEDEILACGVSCGGPLDSNKGIIMCPPNLPDWDNVPLADIISGHIGAPCKVRNDADACALAEWQFGAGRGTENMIFLTFGTGMGAGLILGGRLYSGTNGTAGEVGHIRLTDDGPVGYGKAGSFEGYCSGGGIANLAKKMFSLSNLETELTINDLDARSVAGAARNGDKLACMIYSKCGEKLGYALSILIDIFNPEKIVIGSIFQRSGDLLKEPMYEIIEKEALPMNAAACDIVPAVLGDEIGDYAAIGVAKDFTEGNNG